MTTGTTKIVNLNESAKFKHYLDVHTNEAALIAAYPVGNEGDFAQVQTTDSFWIWNTTGSNWVNSDKTGAEAPANYRDFENLAADPANPAADKVRLYLKGGTTTLKNATGDIFQVPTRTDLNEALRRSPSYLFNSDTDTIEIPNTANVNFPYQDFTIAIFGRFTKPTGNKYIYNKYGDSRGYQAYINATGKLSIYLEGDIASKLVSSTLPILNDPEEMTLFIVHRQSEGQLDIYKNGSLFEANLDISGVGDLTSTIELTIGRSVNSLNMTVGSFILFNTALAASFIRRYSLNPDAIDYGHEGASNDNLAFNGGFDTDSSWQKQTSWTIAAGIASFNGDTGYSLYQSQPIIPGKYVMIGFDVVGYQSGGVRSNFSGQFGNTRTANGKRYFDVFQYSAGNSNLYIQSVGASVLSIDNVFVLTIGEMAAFHSTGIGLNGWKDKYGLFAQNNGATPFNTPVGHEEEIILDASQSIEIGIQPAGYRVIGISIANNDIGAAVEIKVQQESGLYLLGDAGTYKSITADSEGSFQPLEQSLAKTDKTLDLIVNGTGKDIRIGIHLKKE
jgi:hypothetical protein